ncbi:hypothetical protein NP233_g3547 [Leucocoprinus birnbaumii]|uniref:Uncharacterized protein n=1 Tax=Leucocoprinus birnbaumii TaxID=56174 RepID=A0AAD5YXW8_9AGAR|nr:hypothetical protein NP233_g3547 [Leucocoprinus birnbaumii]
MLSDIGTSPAYSIKLFLELALVVSSLRLTSAKPTLRLPGSAISWNEDFKKRVKGQSFPAVIEYVLNWAASSTSVLGWPGIISVLLVRRLPAIFVLHKWVPEIANWKETLLRGHFAFLPLDCVEGLMGVSAIFVSCLAVHRLPEPQNFTESQEAILAVALPPVVGFAVLASIVVQLVMTTGSRLGATVAAAE